MDRCSGIVGSAPANPSVLSQCPKERHKGPSHLEPVYAPQRPEIYCTDKRPSDLAHRTLPHYTWLAMCGRYVTRADAMSWQKLMAILDGPLETPPEPREVSVGSTSPVLENTSGQLKVTKMIWGLRASSSRTGLTFNARSERVFDLHREAMSHRRCLVPVSGFFIFSGSKQHRSRHFVTLPEVPLFSLAALFYPARAPDVAPRYAILTTAAAPHLSGLHERMPVVLNGVTAGTWLRTNNPNDLGQLFCPCPALTLAAPSSTPQLELFSQS